MDAGVPEKRPVRLTIFNQSYTLLVAGDTGPIEQAATVVDELITSLAKTRNLDQTRAAVFACLHLADKLQTIEQELNDMRQRVDDRSRRISSLLDQVIAD